MVKTLFVVFILGLASCASAQTSTMVSGQDSVNGIMNTIGAVTAMNGAACALGVAVSCGIAAGEGLVGAELLLEFSSPSTDYELLMYMDEMDNDEGGMTYGYGASGYGAPLYSMPGGYDLMGPQ